MMGRMTKPSLSHHIAFLLAVHVFLPVIDPLLLLGTVPPALNVAKPAAPSLPSPPPCGRKLKFDCLSSNYEDKAPPSNPPPPPSPSPHQRADRLSSYYEDKAPPSNPLPPPPPEHADRLSSYYEDKAPPSNPPPPPPSQHADCLSSCYEDKAPPSNPPPPPPSPPPSPPHLTTFAHIKRTKLRLQILPQLPLLLLCMFTAFPCIMRMKLPFQILPVPLQSLLVQGTLIS